MQLAGKSFVHSNLLRVLSQWCSRLWCHYLIIQKSSLTREKVRGACSHICEYITEGPVCLLKPKFWETHTACVHFQHLIQSVCGICEGKHSTKNAFSPLRRNKGAWGTKSKLTEMEHNEAACTYKLRWEHGSIPNTCHRIFAGGTWSRDIRRRQAGRPLTVWPCEASGNPLFGPRH